MRPEDVKRVFRNSAEDLVDWITKGTSSFLCGFFNLFVFVVVISCSGNLAGLCHTQSSKVVS